MTNIPSEDILESLYKLRIRRSDVDAQVSKVEDDGWREA